MVNQNYPFGKLDQSKIKKILTAKITSITLRGVMTIRFNDSLAIGNSINKLDIRKLLKIQIRDGLSNIID